MTDELRDESVAHRALLAHVAHFEVGGDGALRPCCVTPENLTRENAVPQRTDLVVRLCRRCGRRHFTMHTEPGVIIRPGGGASA